MTASQPLDGVLLTIGSEQALELAASRREGQPLSTVGLLLGIIAADTVGDWSDAQLRTTYLDPNDVRSFPDPQPAADGIWHGVPLSTSTTTALCVAVQIAAEYRLVPIPPAVLALGLLADPDAGATRAILSEAETSQAELLELIQTDILDLELEGLDLGVLLSASKGRRPSASPTPASRAVLGDPGWVTPDETALAMLAKAVRQTEDDAQLANLLSGMLLDAESLEIANRELSDLSDEQVETVRERILRRYDSETPDPLEIVVGCALSRSPRVTEALRRHALSCSELGGQVAELRERRAGNDDTTREVLLAALFNGLCTLATTVLVVAAAVDGSWWKLLFVPVVWTGYPQNGPVASSLVAAVLFVVVSPLAGLAHLAGIGADLLQALAERQALLARTGVHVTLRELRAIVNRLLRPRGLRAQRQIQRIRARIRAARDGRTFT